MNNDANHSNSPSKDILIQFIADACELKVPINEAREQTLTQLDIDSLELFELAMKLESAYQIDLEAAEVTPDMTLSCFVDNLLDTTK